MKVFQTFNLSLHPQSFLTRAITDITGREPGHEFDLDSLVGREVELVIKHNEGNDGRVYANVRTILPQTAAENAEEKRVGAMTEKVKEQGRPSHTVKAPEPEPVKITDADIPF